jgi:hypothetical protein
MTPNMHRTSSAALIIRINCVLGSRCRQMRAQIATISDKRKAKNMIVLNMHLGYPILTLKSSGKYPIMIRALPHKSARRSPGGRIRVLDLMQAFLSRTTFFTRKNQDSEKKCRVGVQTTYRPVVFALGLDSCHFNTDRVFSLRMLRGA